MRNVLLVLVPLCIGFTSGFIVPSVLRELLIDDFNNIHLIRNRNIRTRDTKTEIATNSKSKDTVAKTFRSPKTLCTENNIINKLEEDLYENTTKKDVNVDERSFIFIKSRTEPLRKHVVVNAMPKRNDDDKTRASYSLNRNNFDEFRRRFSVGLTNTDKGDTSLILTESENQYNVKTMNGFNNNNSKGQRKYLVTYIKPFLKLTKVTSKPEVNHFRDMFVQQRLIQKVSNKNPYKFFYPGEKTIDAIGNPNEGIYLLDNNKKLSNGNSNDGDETIERLIKNKSVGQEFGSKNNSHPDHFGLHYSPDYGEKSMKQNLSNRVFFEKKCKCKIPK